MVPADGPFTQAARLASIDQTIAGIRQCPSINGIFQSLAAFAHGFNLRNSGPFLRLKTRSGLARNLNLLFMDGR
jgi:hypothetical protein